MPRSPPASAGRPRWPSAPARRAPTGRPRRRIEGLRRRLDSELVRRGLVSSRDRAQAEIAAGRVLVRGVPATKAARMVGADDPVALQGPAPRFVSRGGEKLDAALDRFAVDVAGRSALDAGASTGGFTDCLLQRGALEVVAVDVGRGQLDARLRGDPRVTVRERTNVRHLTLGHLGREGRPFDVLVADLAFISLRTVAPALLGLVGQGADVVVLVKPQFEAGRAEAGRERGVIKDPRVWAETLTAVLSAYADHGAAILGVMVSPLLGAQGNTEFLAHLAARRHPAGDLTRMVAAAVDEAVAHRTGA
ncbi:MAG TPA: TlyA family RNA methyltransferase [Acidimicrobiales bacterium]|nr:TlyA family RNA methyltransferase [Acidimicrobiales bacterium]